MLGLKGSDRIQLKRILKELEAEGAIEGSSQARLRQARRTAGRRVLIEITGTDDDGELLARPLNWESNEEPPLIYVVAAQGRRRRPDPATGCWRGWKGMAKPMKPASSAGWSAKPPPACSACCAKAPSAGWRLVPIDKKARTEYALDKSDLGGAKNNELVAAEPKPGRIAGFARVQSGRAHRQHGFAQDHQPDRHSRPRHSRPNFPKR